MKKNTLLYLDSHLVELAKREGLNLSKVMEDRLNEILFERRSPGELGFWDFLEIMRDKYDCEMYFLPFQVKRLKLENVAMFESFEADFKRGNVNLILGGGGTGKSTILRSIAHCFGVEGRYFRKPGRLGKAGRIDVEVYPHSNLLTAQVKEENVKSRFHNVDCILLNDLLQILNSNRVKTFLRQLEKLKKQVIITATRDRVPEALQNKNTILLKIDPADRTRAISEKLR